MEYNVKIEDEKTLILKFNGVGNFIKEISENRIVCNSQFVHSIRDILKSHAINTNPSPTSAFDSIIDGNSIRLEQQGDSLLIYKYKKDSIQVEEVVEEPIEEEYKLPTHRKPYREELSKYKADQASRSKVGSLLSLLALAINNEYEVIRGHDYLKKLLSKEELNHFDDCMLANQRNKRAK